MSGHTGHNHNSNTIISEAQFTGNIITLFKLFFKNQEFDSKVNGITHKKSNFLIFSKEQKSPIFRNAFSQSSPKNII